MRCAISTMPIGYLGCFAHFNFWIKGEAVELASVDSLLVKRFLLNHLTACTCPAPCYGAVANSGAALRYLLKLLPHERPISVAANPIASELEQFGDYLTNTCGVANITRERRVKDVSAFLVHIFGTQPTTDTLPLSVARLDGFLAGLSPSLRPVSLRIVCNSLRSYFRYRALLGESTARLAAALPRIADWRHATLPKALSDCELDAFLNAFDCTDPVGMRDYAIARCLLDLGLRGCEVSTLLPAFCGYVKPNFINSVWCQCIRVLPRRWAFMRAGEIESHATILRSILPSR